MCTFIDDYLQCPSLAVRNAQAEQSNRLNDIDPEQAYAEISSPEFRLYEAIVLFS